MRQCSGEKITSLIPPPSSNLIIGLGANLPSSVGEPIYTLLDSRTKIESIIREWTTFTLGKNKLHMKNKYQKDLSLKWSPLFQTEPLGGPKNQSPYINAVLVVEGTKLEAINPSKEAAFNLLNKFLSLEKEYGRDREHESVRWGPRTLDIDLLVWGNFHIKEKALTIPHPRIFERSFVIVPLGEAISPKNNPPKKIFEESWPESSNK